MTKNKIRKLFLVILFVSFSIHLISCESARKKKKEAKIKARISSGCKIKIPEDIPQNEPLYLLEKKGIQSLFIPNGKETTFKPKDDIVLLCPGKQNTLGSSKLNNTKLLCMENKKFGISNKQVSFRTLNCTKDIHADLRSIEKPCANGQGTLNEIGFTINKKVFLKLFDVCYSMESSSVIYSTHKIHGKSIQPIILESDRRAYKTVGIPKGTRPSESYKRDTQINHFKEIFGETQQYFNETSYFARAHLTPEMDFVFSSHQFATYFFVNVAPQFQAINQGNWLQVEKLARMVAQKYQGDLTIYTGVYERLTLPSERTGRRTLFLEDGDKIEVPKYFWKILYNETSDAAIVMVTLNNPFAKPVDAQSFCPNICSSVGLISAGLKSLKKGYTFCCDLNEFKKKVTTVPSTLYAKSTLELSSISFG